MFSIHIKTSIALLILGYILGYCTPSLFRSYKENVPIRNETVVPAKDLRKQAEAIETKYQEEITKLEKKNEELQKELTATKTQLVQAKIKTTETEHKIKKLVEPKGFSAKELLQRVHTSDPDTTDSNCDSLIKEVGIYIQENHEKDSLYESQIASLDSVVSVKDSIIHYNATVSDSLHQIFTQALSQQELLQKENYLLKRQFKRQKIKSKLITVGLMFLSGAAANYLLHH